MVIKAEKKVSKALFYPNKMCKRSRIVNNLEVYGVENIKQVIDFFNEDIPLERTEFDTEKRISEK